VEEQMTSFPSAAKLCALTVVVVLSTTSAHAETSITQLIGRCEKKMDVYERVDGSIKVVGERLDSFCEGYLLAAYETMADAGEVKTPETPSAEYLKSIVVTFRRDNPAKGSGPAASVVRAAYLRALPSK
jgi:hypothetical protein